MNKFLHLLRRGATASPAEWQCRTQQALFTGRNWLRSIWGQGAFQRGHLSSLKVPSEELSHWWKSRANPWFFDVERDLTLRELSTSAESGLPWVLSQADAVVAGKMPLFSYQPMEFRHPDRWHRDFILQKTAPRKFYGAIRYLDVEEVGDSKHVWEPNRFGWAWWLGLAYRITSERKYADVFAQLTTDWFEQNPYPIGINYCSALEVGFRSYAWVWALDLFADFLADQPELLTKLLQGIWVGCRHIEANLSTYFSPNTHLTGEAFALYACGAGIPEFEESPRWRQQGQAILAREAKRQFYRDGTHRELSSGYHIYSTDFYLQACLIGLQTGYQVDMATVHAARQFALRLAQLAPPDLKMPSINDCDGGRVTVLVPDALDAAPSLAAAKMLFPDLALDTSPARGYALLMRPRSRELPIRLAEAPPNRLPPEREISGLLDSGLVAHRNVAGDYLLFRAAPFGYDACPHSHDAPLGIVLHLGGQPVFVDNGVGSYTQSTTSRNSFRAATGKNTILINQTGPSIAEGWFSWKKTTDCQLVTAQAFVDGFRARGRHTGFSDPPEFHVFIQREVVMLDVGIVAIIDRWDADAEVTTQSRFTLHPEVSADAARQLLDLGHGACSVHFLAVSLDKSETPSIGYGQGPYSANYGQQGQTEFIAVTSRSARRGSNVLLLSRIGKIVPTDEGDFFRIEGSEPVQLRLSALGVTPSRADGHVNPAFQNTSVG